MSRSPYLILSGIFFFTTAQTMVMILVPLAAASMVTSKTLVGLIVAVPGFLSLVADLPCAALSDRVGRRRMLVVGSGMSIIAAVTLSRSNEYLGLVLGITLSGLANSFWWGSALAYVSEASSPEDHAHVQGYNGGLQGLSAFIGALLAGILVDATGFAVAFVVVAVLGTLTALVALQTEETVKRADSQFSFTEIINGYRHAGRLLCTRTQIQMAGVIGLLYGIVIFSVGNSFFPLYVTTQIGYSSTLAGSLLSVRNLLGALVSPLFGPTVSRFGPFRAILVSQALGSLGLLLVPWTSSAVMMFVLLGAQGAGFGFAPAAANILVAAGTSLDDRAVGFACVGLFWRGSMLVLPPLLGLLAEVAGMHLVFVAGGLLAGLCITALAVLILRRSNELELVPYTRSQS